jgi:hypothetical protein
MAAVGKAFPLARLRNTDRERQRIIICIIPPVSRPTASAYL